jgi:hypothetical protein
MKSGLFLFVIPCENELERTTDLGVGGSNPSARAIKFKQLRVSRVIFFPSLEDEANRVER